MHSKNHATQVNMWEKSCIAGGYSCLAENFMHHKLIFMHCGKSCIMRRYLCIARKFHASRKIMHRKKEVMHFKRKFIHSGKLMHCIEEIMHCKRKNSCIAKRRSRNAREGIHASQNEVTHCKRKKSCIPRKYLSINVNYIYFILIRVNTNIITKDDVKRNINTASRFIYFDIK